MNPAPNVNVNETGSLYVPLKFAVCQGHAALVQDLLDTVEAPGVPGTYLPWAPLKQCGMVSLARLALKAARKGNVAVLAVLADRYRLCVAAVIRQEGSPATDVDREVLFFFTAALHQFAERYTPVATDAAEMFEYLMAQPGVSLERPDFSFAALPFSLGMSRHTCWRKVKETALHAAIVGGNALTASMLIAAGGNLEPHLGKYRTFLSEAMFYMRGCVQAGSAVRFLDTIQLLLDSGHPKTTDVMVVWEVGSPASSVTSLPTMQYACLQKNVTSEKIQAWLQADKEYWTTVRQMYRMESLQSRLEAFFTWPRSLRCTWITGCVQLGLLKDAARKLDMETDIAAVALKRGKL